MEARQINSSQQQQEEDRPSSAGRLGIGYAGMLLCVCTVLTFMSSLHTH